MADSNGEHDRPRSVAFCHLDLGVGGAERFIVDSAREVQEAGHTVHLYTSHYDTSRCFEETKELTVRTVGRWLPMTVFGVATVICATLRMLAIAMHIIWLHARRKERYSMIVVDQVSAIVPLLRTFTRAQIVFYGHFPDQLLARHSSSLRRTYRAPFDALERWSTRRADRLLVNSAFTKRVYSETFGAEVGARADVLYPCVAAPSDAELQRDRESWRGALEDELINWLDGGHALLSLNRFERKKDIGLAIRGLHEVIHRHALSSGACAQCRLVVAGGHDPRVSENARVLRELRALAEELGVEDRVVFLTNVTDAQRRALIDASKGMIYTPQNEHFGIVPLEAMARGCPVVACNSGGPLETVVHTQTGFIAEPTALCFANAMVLLLTLKADAAAEMRAAARARVRDAFSRQTFARSWRAVLAGEALVDAVKKVA